MMSCFETIHVAGLTTTHTAPMFLQLSLITTTTATITTAITTTIITTITMKQSATLLLLLAVAYAVAMPMDSSEMTPEEDSGSMEEPTHNMATGIAGFASSVTKDGEGKVSISFSTTASVSCSVLWYVSFCFRFNRRCAGWKLPVERLCGVYLPTPVASRIKCSRKALEASVKSSSEFLSKLHQLLLSGTK